MINIFSSNFTQAYNILFNIDLNQLPTAFVVQFSTESMDKILIKNKLKILEKLKLICIFMLVV